ncbi:ets DNA-binding protein pokkuri isoform X2 [Thrips palmi]|nr:ets DNA-binding protein pokkuri isoform X2 [Thrips palmi]
MKLLPISLPPSGVSAMERLPLSLPFGASDLLWRYPGLNFNVQQGANTPQPAAAPMFDFKNHLPAALATDPRIWSREDVCTFLRWCEREFDLPNFDMDMFQMNGKALCLLTKTDLGERCPGAGDVLHNVLQMLVRDAQFLTRCLPSSPVTPTSRHFPPAHAAHGVHSPHHVPHPLSPAHTHPPPTPNWSLLVRPGGELAPHADRERLGERGGGGGGGGGGGHPHPGLAHLMGSMASLGHAGLGSLGNLGNLGHGNSVTLSPAPSLDSQSGSPQHPLEHGSVASSFPLLTGFGGSNGSSGSTQSQSDSEEDSYPDGANGTNAREQNGNGSTGSTGSTGSGSSPPSTPSYLVTGAPSHAPHTPHTPASPRSPAVKEPATPTSQTASSGSLSLPTTPGTPSFRPSSGAREFFPDTPEPNTNGRLLWDFLQQLLNDASQRYTSYIAWKNRDTGVFKIVDPAGLAKLWGIQKNHLSMNYDKMSRALRYYYRVNILRKVQGERHCYQFLRNPTELKNIKNISLLRQQMSPTRPAPPAAYNGNSTNATSNSNTHQATSPPSPVPMMIKVEPDLDIDDTLEDAEDMPTDLSMMSSQSQRRQQDQQAAATDLSSHSSDRGHFIAPEVSITSKYVREMDSPSESQNSAYPLSFGSRPNETADNVPFPLTLPRRSEPADSEESK